MPVRLSPPHTWCDANCERCPVLDDCELARPPDLRLRKSEAQLRLERRAKRYQLAAYKLANDSSAFDGVGWAVAIVAAKVARVSAWLLPTGEVDPDMHHDSDPNLILVERALAAIARVVDRDRGRLDVDRVADLEAAEVELRGALAPLLAAIDPLVRGQIERLVAKGRAPSPFCRVAP